MSWATLLALAAGTYLLKAVGPVILGARALPPSLAVVTAMLPAALLAALVATQTLGGPGGLTVDARLAGLAVAGLAVWRRAPFLVVILAASLTTALVRAVAG